MQSIIFVVLFCAAMPAWAQGPAQSVPSPASPAERQAPVPSHRYTSVFGDYKAYREPALTPWAEANRGVASSGVHQGHGNAVSNQAAGKPAPTASERPSVGAKQHGSERR